MDGLIQAHEQMVKGGSLSKTADEVQKLVYQLQAARQAIASSKQPFHSDPRSLEEASSLTPPPPLIEPDSAPLVLAKIKNPVKQSLDKAHASLKEIYSAQSKYSKVLDKRFKPGPFPDGDFEDALQEKTDLIDQAIVMHLLREGDFDIASTFKEESGSKALDEITEAKFPRNSHKLVPAQFDFMEPLDPDSLEQQFGRMYGILAAMERHRNLLPAMEWAHAHSELLEERGSTFEFDLEKLWFVWLLHGRADNSTPEVSNTLRAVEYARQMWDRFAPTNMHEIQELMGSIAYVSNPESSPYAALFDDDDAWTRMQESFSREYCSLLGLSANSPLYLAVTAGSIALPTLLKYKHINKTKRTEWTSLGEAPVEVPLPPGFVFHSIYVCPVSKEQCTEDNPPMLLPCGHMIAQTSLRLLSKNSRFKCHYCPVESHPSEALPVYL